MSMTNEQNMLIFRHENDNIIIDGKYRGEIIYFLVGASDYMMLFCGNAGGRKINEL